MGNLKRKVRIKDPDTKEIEFETVPMPIMYTPIKLKGVGALPWTLMGANKDAVMYLRYNRVQREELIKSLFFSILMPVL